MAKKSTSKTAARKASVRKKAVAKKRVNYKSLYDEKAKELEAQRAATIRINNSAIHDRRQYNEQCNKLRYDWEQERRRRADEINRLRSENQGFLGQVADVAAILADFEQRIAGLRDAITSLPGYNRPPMTGVTRKWSAI